MNVSDKVFLLMGWMGVFSPMALAAVGSVIGCARAGQAACGAILETESGHGRFIGASAMPSSQTIYGIVIMLSLSGSLNLANAPGIFAIGLLTGVALLFSAIYQGYTCASAIQTSKSKPEVFGISLAPAALVEGFSVFTFVFALVLAGLLPGGK
jgi:V/A-type H+-transporting ATPase subunit K